jgi:hypothetical protein
MPFRNVSRSFKPDGIKSSAIARFAAHDPIFDPFLGIAFNLWASKLGLDCALLMFETPLPARVAVFARPAALVQVHIVQ